MRLITKKENQALIIEGQEKKHEYLFSIEAIGIKTAACGEKRRLHADNHL